MRLGKRVYLLLVAFCLILPPVLFSQSITAVYIPDAIAGGGGTGTTGYPYAVYVRIQNWTAGANAQVYLKIYNNTNNEFMWSATGVWSSNTTYSTSNQPVALLDASGNWSGSIYAKHNDNVGVSASLRARIVNTTTQLTVGLNPFNILTLSASGNGGWIVRQNSPAVNKGILAYSAGSIVGTYRTEDNGITEGYSYGPGGFKIAVPAGLIDSLATINNDGSRDQVFVGPWHISAGQETDASSSGVVFGKGSAFVRPATLAGGRSQTVTLLVKGQLPFTIRAARVIVPANWTWTHQADALSLIGSGTPSALVSGDTVAIIGLSLQGDDSLQVRINDIAPIDTTAYFSFGVQSGTTPDSIYAISVQPSVFVYSTPLPISDVKAGDGNGVPFRNNQLVTVRGLVTEAGQLGKICYMQDNSGGMAVFDSSFAGAVTIGDEVIVSGLVQPFSGLTEIVNPILHSIVTSGNMIEPLTVTASQIAHDGAGGVEVYEGRLVRINGVTVVGAGGYWNGNTNYSVFDRTDTTQLRIDRNTELASGSVPVPASAFDLIGVDGQFVTAAPYIGGYQILPRFRSDILSSGPIFVSLPLEQQILPSALTITWETLTRGTTRVRYGKTPLLELGVSGNDTLLTSHTVQLSGLDPATIYYIQAFSVAGKDTSVGSTLVASTASPPQTTGEINVYFNHSVNTNLAWFRPALGNQNLLSRLLPRLRNAHRSIDAALYSLSGAPGDSIVRELAAARNRGVSVRVICESDNSNSSSFRTLAANAIPLIDDRFDPVNAGAGLMHNKFFVIDGRGGKPESVWVWTGSWNPTQPGTFDDYQNSIEIQDQALAGAYVAEFDEMWGSGTAVPNADSSRFGARKSDNTPHRFVISGRQVECYFSPSDRTTSHILSTINSAQHSVAFDLLTFTRTDLADAMVTKKRNGLKVRGVVDNNTDSGTQFFFLVTNQIDVLLKNTSGGLLHHKYCVVDAENPLWNPVTITGSHNWSSAAENSNNENTVIIRDGNIANEYLQEFAARYYQFGGADTIAVGVDEAGAHVPAAYALEQNYPNPFNPTTKLGFGISDLGFVTLKVYDVLGREVATLVNEVKEPGTYTVQFDGSGLSSGVYFYSLEAGNFLSVKKMLLLR